MGWNEPAEAVVRPLMEEAARVAAPCSVMRGAYLRDKRRRGQVDRTIPLQVDGDLMSDALEQVRTVTTLQPPVAS